MNSLAEQYIADTFDGLLHVGGSPLPISGRVTVYDGSGNTSALSIGKGSNGVTVTGELQVTNNLVVGGGGVQIPTGSISCNSGNVNITTGSLNITTGGINLNSGNINMNGSINVNGNSSVINAYCQSTITSNLKCGSVVYPNYNGGSQAFLIQGDGEAIGFKSMATHVSETINLIYPVGSVYMSMYATNPGSLFPGTTWINIGGGYVLAGVGTGVDSNGITRALGAGYNGGEYQHTLSIAEMPAHKHTGVGVVRSGETGDTNNPFATIGTRDSVYHEGEGHTSAAAKGLATKTAPSRLDSELIIDNTGGGGAHTNMPPTLAVYIFQRTA
jgi:hypothetical protein